MKKLKRYLEIFFALLFFSPALAAAAPADSPAPYNVFIVVLNTLNRNRLSLYGYPKRTTPHLDRLARDAYVFTDLVSPTSFTFPVLQSFFKAGPDGPDFYLADPWQPERKYNPLTDYPLPKFIADQGYAVFLDSLPDIPGRPFFAFMHLTDLHYPYDPRFRLESKLTPKSREIYRRLLKENTIRLVDKASWRGSLPEDLSFIALGIRATEIPVSDTKVWNSLLSDLKQTGDSPSARIASALPTRLARRLAQVSSAEGLTLQDKENIVQALNDLVSQPKSPIGKILFDPGTVYKTVEPQTLRISSITLQCGESLLVPNIQDQLKGPEPFLSIRDGRLALSRPLDQRGRLLLSEIYRKALESFLPSLTPLTPQPYCFLDALHDQDAWKKSPGYADELAFVEELYDVRMAEVDQKIGEWLDSLDRRNVLGKTIVVVMGDHGEGLMEHGYFEHMKCYDEIINPPLIVRIPGRLKEKTIVKTQLRTCDVLPMLVGFMGLKPTPYANPAGINLAPFLSGSGPEPDIVAISRGDKTTPLSIRSNDGWKLILDMPSGARELYNRRKDPAEQHNVAKENPDVTAKLEEVLNRFLHGN